MNYAAHDCRSTRKGKCNNRWIDKDVTGATTLIPTWKYCRECCKKLGINFAKQKPSDYRTDEQNKRYKNLANKNRLKYAS